MAGFMVLNYLYLTIGWRGNLLLCGVPLVPEYCALPRTVINTSRRSTCGNLALPYTPKDVLGEFIADEGLFFAN